MAALAIRIIATTLFFVVIWFAIDIEVVWQSLSNANVWGLCFAVLLITATIPLFAIRWLLVNKTLQIKMGFTQSLLALSAAHMLTQTFPSTLGADGYRMLLLKKLGHGLQLSFSSVLLDRATGILGLLLLIAVGQPFLVWHVDNPIIENTALGIQAAIILGLLALRFGHYFFPLLKRIGLAEPIITVIGHLNSKSEAKSITCMVLLSFIGQAAITTTVYLIGRSLGLELSLFSVLFIFPPIYLISMLPITIAGWGVREGSMIAALALLGTPTNDALALSILFGVCMFVVGIIGGLVWLPSGARTPLSSPAKTVQ